MTPAAPTSPKAASGPKAGTATVYQVKSGDTLVLCGPTQPKTAPPLKEISLAAIQAPRLGVKSSSHTTPDEAHAWESREYLRTMLLNKTVQFKVYYEKNNREYAEVRFEGKNIALDILSGGMAKLLSTQETKKIPGFAELEEAATTGETAKVGLYAGAVPREIASSQDSGFNLEEYVSKNKNKRKKAIVEHVRDGACLRVCIIPDAGETQYVYMPIMISGVNGPRRRGGGGESVVEYEPFYHECHYWVESRFLSREVEVRLETLHVNQSNPNQPANVFGSIYHPRGNLAEFLLTEGFATYVDWTAQLTEGGAKPLRDAEQKAKDQKKRKWSTYDGSGEAGKEFKGQVIEICSGDQIRVLNLDDSEKEMRLYLSSVRAPAGASRARPEAEPYSREALEFMRKRLIGKIVKCQPDYVKNVQMLMKKDTEGKVLPGQVGPPTSDDKGNLIFVTVVDDEGNVALDGVKEGLLDVQLHREMDDRSRSYNDLKDAEEVAKTEGKGKHSGAPPLASKIQELTGAQDPSKRKEMARRAEGMFDDLKKKEQIGVVQYCITGTRFRVVIPSPNVRSDNILIAFKINGVNAPNVAPPNADPKLPNSQSEPFGQESLKETKINIMQKEVKLRIEGVDRAGCFRGTCTFQNAQKKKCDLASVLLGKGLAYCDEWNENKEYADVEASAKTNKIGWWSIEHEEQAAPTFDPSKQGVKGEVGNINSISSFYIVDPKSENAIRVNEALAKSQPDTMETADDPKRGSMYLSKYWEDRKWYRTKNMGIKNRANKTFSMLFVDFGVETEVPLSDIKKLPAGHPLCSLPPAAQHCGLYGVKGSDDYWNEGCEALYNATHNAQGKSMPVTCEVEMFREGVCWVILNAGSKCANLEVVNAGAARLVKKQVPKSVANYDAWEEAQKRARRGRVAMWQYGDDYDEEED